MTAPSSVLALVERFQGDITAYKSPSYNETQTRQEFIDPLFEALGWDIGNRGGAAAVFREVVLEYSMKIGAATKAPDYLFQLGGTPRFFVEAKKPSVNLKDDTSPAFQLRRYAWSATLPLSVLTDFEEFVVYDCRVEPNKTDKSSFARMFYVPYTEYAEKWDSIAELFSREAVLGGSLEKFAQEQKAPKGATPVDVAFLREIEGWRELLAKNIAIWNPELTQRELNYAVQMTLDRIIFLRICEDRGIEPYGKLQRLLKGGQLYKQLVEQFRDADDRYNSGLFHFTQMKGREDADTLTPGLYIDDEPLKRIVRGLYYPDSPYEFSVLPVEILGNVYEQFLGKVIHLTKDHEAVVEEKPEVRKAGGVYYTPSYIVDYIVKNTVGKLLEGKTPREAAKLRIVDPACGSGSFLLGAYQYLLDWYLAQYVAAGPAKHKKDLYQGPHGEWKLISAARKRILLDNIYGVDLDAQAVEVTKLSLSLKVLEGESQQTIGSTRSMFQERALPDLSNNIKCGNSLIGQDYQSGQLTDEEQYRINAFDWTAEFAEIMKAGGFDAVIGNPPYIRIHNLVDYYPQEVKFIQESYEAAKFGKVDIYVAFIERGVSILKPVGLLGFIVPNKFMQADYGVGLRKLISRNSALSQLVDFGYAQVFENATIYTCLLFLSGSPRDVYTSRFISPSQTIRDFLKSDLFEEADTKNLTETAWSLTYSGEGKVLQKIETHGELFPEFVELAITGVKTGVNSVFIFETVEECADCVVVKSEDGGWTVELEKDLLFSFWKADSLKRYRNPSATRVLLYPYELVTGKTSLIPEDRMKRDYPKAWNYLNLHRETLEGRQKGKLKGPYWYGLSFSSALQMFTVPKLVTATLAPKNSFSVDAERHLFPQGAGGGCGIVPKSGQSFAYLLGLLNSRVLTFHFQRISSRFQGGWYAYEPRYLNRIPIRPINFSDPADKARHDQMVAYVERMLDLQKRVATKSGQEKTVLQRQIEGTDRQIDNLVYDLYELTPDERRIVEEATK